MYLILRHATHIKTVNDLSFVSNAVWIKIDKIFQSEKLHSLHFFLKYLNIVVPFLSFIFRTFSFFSGVLFDVLDVCSDLLFSTINYDYKYELEEICM